MNNEQKLIDELFLKNNNLLIIIRAWKDFILSVFGIDKFIRDIIDINIDFEFSSMGLYFFDKKDYLITFKTLFMMNDVIVLDIVKDINNNREKLFKKGRIYTNQTSISNKYINKDVLTFGICHKYQTIRTFIKEVVSGMQPNEKETTIDNIDVICEILYSEISLNIKCFPEKKNNLQNNLNCILTVKKYLKKLKNEIKN